MDSMLIVQISFYLVVGVVVVLGMFAFFKGLVTLVMFVVRKPKRSKPSRRFIAREQPAVVDDMRTVNLSQISPINVVGHTKQLSGAVHRLTGTPVDYCDCDRCRRKSGKVKH